MTARPILGVIACNRIVGTETAQAVMDRYIRAAMTYADVAALIVPSLSDLMTAAEVAPRLDGILSLAAHPMSPPCVMATKAAKVRSTRRATKLRYRWLTG
jgi:gamma-glutamyl-gamma-aminobutyrate hydrolase PuuD